MFRLSTLFFIILTSVLAACSGGDDAGGCPAGSAQCACLPSGGCGDGLSCTDGICSVPTCAQGTEGCPCLNGQCGSTTSQEPLACMDGVCQLATCPAGNVGCACINGATCADSAVCVDGLCKSLECIPGSDGCECLAGSCDLGLKCVGSVCIDQTGRIGGGCYPDGTCDMNASCDTTAFPATCVYCDLGEIGCQCDGTTCLPGLACVNGLCSGDPEIQARTIPSDPQCYTPCSNDVTLADGAILTCDSDGLLPGCLDGRVCDNGECVEAGEERKICLADAQCPDFTQCIQGHCYPNCQVDAECSGGLGCHLKVCRQRCTAGKGECPETMLCDAPDGELGFCMPRPSQSGNESTSTPGAISLGTNQLRFSNVDLDREVRVINDSDASIRVSFTKIDHMLVDDRGTVETKSLSVDGDCTATDCPMWWMEMGAAGNITKEQTTEFTVPAHCERDNSCPRITVRIAPPGVSAVRWRGTIRMESPLGTESISLSYVALAEGQWAGKMVYFANFEDEGIDSTDTRTGWLDRDRANIDGISSTDIEVTNGLIKRWGAFRGGVRSWDEMNAVLAATETEQWRWPSVVQDCTIDGGACYLFSDGALGSRPRPYVSDLARLPIPSGSSVFPMAFNLYNDDSDPAEILTGRVVSETALHYPGNPLVKLRFEADPSDEANCDPGVRNHCVVYLRTTNDPTTDGLSLNVNVGARFIRPADGCPDGFTAVQLPWLVPGFERDTNVSNGFLKKTWCVDFRLPAYDSEDIDNISPEDRVENRSLARGNPIPDGQIIRRNVRLLDGAMIDQSRIFLFFRETYPSFLGGEDLKAYGYMLLERRPVDLNREDEDGDGVPEDYEGVEADADVVGADVTTGAVCSADILAEVGYPNGITEANVATAVARMVNGGTGTPLSFPAAAANNTCTGGDEVHYLCEETGLFNGGSDNVSCWGRGGHRNDDGCAAFANNGVCNDGGTGSVNSSCPLGRDATDCGNRYTDTRVECPLESAVTFFTAPAASHTTIVNHECQDTGTCGNVLRNWATSGSVITQVDPLWNCISGSSCDDDSLDRRAGKVFYAANTADVGFTALRPALADAFRYRTRFVNREGTSLGFTPSICQPLGSAVPYCYDPAEIEAIRDRVDCLLSIYEQFYADPNAGRSSDALFTYLQENFAESVPNALDPGPKRTGFEKFYAELLIMLGDQAYTNAFESRFDLAGISSAGFQGDEFEDDGIAVSSIAGYEMFTLHQAVQYYSMALDRFYGISSVISASLAVGDRQTTIRNFVTPETVTVYFDRLIRASTQRSRAWAEIARRYQGFNRADLARRVATRAYNATYLESIALSNTILRVYDQSQGRNKPQLLLALEDAQRRYSMALLDLSNVYQSITDDVNILGFAPDYVPFPALGTGGANIDINAFERIYTFVQSKLESARRREDLALQQTREYDTDDASFQAEVTRLSRTYEQQLAEICGLFTGSDGNSYPAIRQYAYLDDLLSLYGDPCGFVGNGGLHQAIVNVDVARIEMQRVITEIDNVYERIRLQKQRVNDVCKIQDGLAQLRFENAGKIFRLDEQIVRTQEIVENGSRALDTASTIASTLVCEPTTCVQAGLAAVAIGAAGAGQIAINIVAQEKTRDIREDKAALESATALAGDLAGCEIAEAELIAETRTMMLSLNELELTLLAAQLRTSLAISEVSKLRQQAQRLQLEQEEAISLAIDVQAARNNPNVRIYRNDAVLNAELAFQDALREAYRLTLVYEYYTSQSYAAREQLFLTRMVALGDYNLENYVADLRNAFLSFEEQFGNPDLRVTQVSLVNDIFAIPRIGEDGEALSADERAARMRAQLLDSKYLNRDGYISIPFSTRLQEVSPVTRNHKIFYVEANIEGNDNGDFIGRVYVRQRGTSTIRTIEGGNTFFRFPERTAVINPAFNAQRPVELSSSTEVYRSYRLRDLPLVNDNWELIFNQRDEAANLDVNLNELTDIKLYIFYTDFTVY